MCSTRVVQCETEARRKDVRKSQQVWLMTRGEPRFTKAEAFLLFDPLAGLSELPSVPWPSTHRLGLLSHRPAHLLPVPCCPSALSCPRWLLEIHLQGLSGSTTFLKVVLLEQGVVASQTLSHVESRVNGSRASPLLSPGYSCLQQIFKILIAIIIIIIIKHPCICNMMI